MPNPLDRNVLPDDDRMRTTTAWILQREPTLVRVAPLVVVVVVAVLGIWLATARVTVYDSVSGRISHVHSGIPTDTLDVQLDGDERATLTANSSVFVVPAGARNRIPAAVLDTNESTGRARLTVASSAGAKDGPVTVRVEAGRRSLLSELVGTARAEGRKP